MKRAMISLLACVLLALSFAATGDKEAMKLADGVFKASGGKSWGKIKRIQFTFNVEEDGKLTTSVRHDWNLKKNTDTVSWDGKTVTIDLSAANAEGDARDAYRRWVNDSYWLLAPLKLKDGGVKLTHKGTQDVEGEPMQVLHVSFESVGLTPTDQYNFYIDPKTRLVRKWDFIPNPDRKVSGAWKEYQSFGPLKLSTEREFGGKRIFFSKVKVDTN